MSCKTLLLILVLAASLLGCGGDDPAASRSRTMAQIVAVNGVATLSGPLGNYTITKSGTDYIVKDNVGNDGSNTFSNVQSLKFSDVTVSLIIGSKSTTLEPEDLKSLIELYIAFFNRVPDADGLGYWIDQFNAGQSLIQIGNSFYQAAIQFSALTGYSANMSDADFVTVVYKNVLGRSTPDATGLAYWTKSLASGAETRGSLVKSILTSAHTFKGDPTYGYVADLLDNKVTVADKFAVDQGLNYNTPEASITNGMAIAAAVTPTSTSAATKVIDATLVTTPVVTYAGDYTGTYSGTDSGTFSITMSANGSISGSGRSTLDASYSFSIAGSIAAGGTVLLQASGTAGSATFKGSVDSANGKITGTWTNPVFGDVGTFTAQTQRVATTISGIVSIGPVSNATVTAFTVVNGVKATPLASVTTDASGKYTMQIGAYTGPVLLEAVGGSYVDPSSGLVFSLTTVLRASITTVKGANTANITPLTEVIVLNASSGSGGLSSANLAGAGSSIQNQLGFDPVNTTPWDPSQPVSSAATSNSLMYAANLGTVSQYVAENPDKTFPLVLSDFAAYFKTLGTVQSQQVSNSANNYGANSRNVNGLLSTLAPGKLATCSNSLNCFGPGYLPRCPAVPVISCLGSKVPVNGVCVTANTTPVTPNATLTKTWTGPWDWAGPSAAGCPVSDGGTLTMKLTQSGTTFSGSLIAAGLPGIQSANTSTCKITGTTTQTSGNVSGTVNGNNIDFTMNIDGDTLVLKFTGKGTLSGGVLSGSLVRSTGGSGSFNLH
ncbi:DUF4214 domain-containing protein [Undibacterium terreum]|uniref:DUF4214 domain-containing protein n=1 Tax=Undibacterium terreum TaxID=1224302 RepID=A0A916XPK7_9BURK|nr:DUF4214 domain-containing protein [Undibacterium terreum]GGC89797.1 hypothetical protein GCM10011396_41290 [Undibacterium terreum]